MSELPIGETGPAGAQGPAGPSVYDLWLAANPGGTWTEFLEALKGEPGVQGPAGLDSTAVGATGPTGPSLFDLWLEDNPGGTRAAFLTAMRGPAGPAGPRSLAEIRTVNSDVRRIYLNTTTPADGVQPGDLQLDPSPTPVAGRRWSTGSAQSIATATYETMGLGANTDYSGGVSGGSGGIVVPVAGWYHVAAGVTFLSASGYRILRLQRNGSDETRQVGPDSGQNVTTMTISTLVKCAAGDAFSCLIWQNSGGSLATSVSFGFPYIAVALVARS